MSLDLMQVAEQIERMAAKLQAGQEEKQHRLQLALDTFTFAAKKFDFLKRRIETSKTTWLTAGLEEELDLRASAPPCPDNFVVLAVDGSHIDVDRHRSTYCFVINIGMVRLDYGKKPAAFLHSSPLLYFDETEVVLNSPDGMQQEVIEGTLLGVKRSIEECRILAKLAEDVEDNLPIVALLDGSLILWGLVGKTYPNFVIDTLLGKGLLPNLDKLKQLSQSKPLALASYISFPRNTEVVNVLRLAICPYESVDCDRYCAGKFERKDCDKVAGILDRELFDQLLDVGGRSAIFSSRSSIVREYYREHQVYFFYLKTDEEVARLEMPGWVAKNKKLVELLHSIVLDQCQRGRGYPVAISEAHEKAVITAADKELFWELVDKSLNKEKRLIRTSAKSWSKRTRWV